MATDEGRAYTGAILAGGQSRRMGAPKEGVPLWDGRPMMAHAIAALAGVCRRVVVVGECRGFALPPEILHIPDRRPGDGPLAGLDALLRSGLDAGYLVVACDQPLLTPALLRRLLPPAPADLCFFRSEEGAGLHPFPGFFPATWAARAAEALERGERSVRRAIAPCPATWVDVGAREQALLRSLNTPAEVDAVLRDASLAPALREVEQEQERERGESHEPAH